MISSEMKHLFRPKEVCGENGILHRSNSLELTAHSEGLIVSLSEQYIQASTKNLSNRCNGNLLRIQTFWPDVCP